MALNTQIELINNMIVSINELKNVLLIHSDIDDKLIISLREILNVLKKALDGVPEVLMYAHGKYIPKDRLTSAYLEALVSFEGYPKKNKNFALYWEDFINVWQKYSDQMKEIESSPSAVFLSLN